MVLASLIGCNSKQELVPASNISPHIVDSLVVSSEFDGVKFGSDVFDRFEEVVGREFSEYADSIGMKYYLTADYTIQTYDKDGKKYEVTMDFKNSKIYVTTFE